jgi:hypothetical protein
VVGFTIGSRGEVPRKRKPVIKEQLHNNNRFNSLFYVLHEHNVNNSNNNKGILGKQALK